MCPARTFADMRMRFRRFQNTISVAVFTVRLLCWAGQLNCPVSAACAPASAMYNKLYKRRECLQEWEGELANREDNSNNSSCFIDSFCWMEEQTERCCIQHRLCILWDWKLLWLKHKEWWGCWQNVAGCNDQGQEKYIKATAEYFHGSKVELAISRSSCFSFLDKLSIAIGCDVRIDRLAVLKHMLHGFFSPSLWHVYLICRLLQSVSVRSRPPYV